MSSPPSGIWWDEPEQEEAENYYTGPTASTDSAVGRDQMAAKQPDVTWQEFWAQLAERLPYFDNWETYTLPSDTGDPKAFLTHLRTIASRGLKQN